MKAMLKIHKIMKATSFVIICKFQNLFETGPTFDIGKLKVNFFMKAMLKIHKIMKFISEYFTVKLFVLG